MANSFTGVINTNGEFVTVESVTVGVEGSNFTGFTNGKTYVFQANRHIEFKVSDAIFSREKGEILYLKQGADDIYVMTDLVNQKGLRLSIFEEEE